MKQNTLLYNALLVIVILTTACAEDKGNYSYTPVNEVTIEAIDDLMLVAGARIQITPSITIDNENAANLSYIWTIAGNVVSTERNLDIDLPPLAYGGHLCALTIVDNDNGMQYRRTFDLTVTNPFNFGYYFLTRRDDGSTEMAYIPSNVDDDATAEDVLYATGVGEYAFGNEPVQIYGSYGYTSDYSATRWELTFLTAQGEYPTIVTDNNTFLPVTLISNECFIAQDQGYDFKPECTVISMRREQFFISDGQFLRYSTGKLYRPARHTQNYYWSHPVMGASGATFAWVFDELSKRYYDIRPYTADNPELGIIADSYAYDDVIEPENNVTIEGNILYASDAYYNGGHLFNVYTTATGGINIYTFTKPSWGVRQSTYTGSTLLPLSNAREDMRLVVGTNGISNGIFYVSNGNEIYSSPTTLPTLTPYCTIPSDLGVIEYMGISARGNRLVVVLYDENSSSERKGSVVYVDLTSRTITHTFEHIMHHCAAYWGANESSSAGYGSYGDRM